MPSQLCLVCACRKSTTVKHQLANHLPLGRASTAPIQAPLPRSISPVASQQPHRHKERNKREAEPSYKLEHIWRRNKLPPPPPGADAPWEARLREPGRKRSPARLVAAGRIPSKPGWFPARMERIIRILLQHQAKRAEGKKRNPRLRRQGSNAGITRPNWGSRWEQLSRRRPPEGWAGWAR